MNSFPIVNRFCNELPNTSSYGGDTLFHDSTVSKQEVIQFPIGLVLFDAGVTINRD
jgi:hypothetical protein